MISFKSHDFHLVLSLWLKETGIKTGKLKQRYFSLKILPNLNISLLKSLISQISKP